MAILRGGRYMRGKVAVNAKRCVACKRCEIECGIAHSLGKDLVGAVFEVPRIQHRIDVVETDKGIMPRVCRHCGKPKCVEACPTGALKSQPDGIVSYDVALCDSCYKCIEACPFDAIRQHPAGGIIKCDLCVERLDRGELPACVCACHVKALTFKPAAEKAAAASPK